MQLQLLLVSGPSGWSESTARSHRLWTTRMLQMDQDMPPTLGMALGWWTQGMPLWTRRMALTTSRF